MDQDNLNRLRERTGEYSSTRDRLTLFFVLVLTPYASNRRVEGGRSRRQGRRGFCLSRSRCVVGMGLGSDRRIVVVVVYIPPFVGHLEVWVDGFSTFWEIRYRYLRL